MTTGTDAGERPCRTQLECLGWGPRCTTAALDPSPKPVALAIWAQKGSGGLPQGCAYNTSADPSSFLCMRPGAIGHLGRWRLKSEGGLPAGHWPSWCPIGKTAHARVKPFGLPMPTRPQRGTEPATPLWPGPSTALNDLLGRCGWGSKKGGEENCSAGGRWHRSPFAQHRPPWPWCWQGRFRGLPAVPGGGGGGGATPTYISRCIRDSCELFFCVFLGVGAIVASFVSTGCPLGRAMWGIFGKPLKQAIQNTQVCMLY